MLRKLARTLATSCSQTPARCASAAATVVSASASLSVAGVAAEEPPQARDPEWERGVALGEQLATAVAESCLLKGAMSTVAGARYARLW